MALKQKLRSEISDEYKWNLEVIYPSIEAWYEDYNKVKEELPEISEYQAKLMDSAKNLYDFIVLSNDIERRVEKLYTYAHLHNDEDTNVVIYQELVGKVSDLLDQLSERETFFKPLLLKYDYTTIEKFYEEEPKLKEYEFFLQEFFRYKDHVLSENEEKIVTSFNKIFRVSEDSYEKLTDTDMTFGMFIDENGNRVELTDSNYTRYISSKNRRVRKRVFEMLYKRYGDFRNTIATTFAGNVNTLQALAKVYKFNSSLEASLYHDNISLDVYNNLIKTVNSRMNAIYRYYNLRKKVLGLNKQHMYDIYVGLIGDQNIEYSFSEAKDTVLKALSVLGSDYVDILKKAFDEKWIDVYNNRGKRGGAYSGGCYDTAPYILLNYENRLEDVSTLAHELGHSVHSYYSRENNPYHYSQYRIFVAEVASTVNELLLAEYLLKNSKDKEEKLSILNNLLQLYRATIYRQTMFAEFEKDMAEFSQKGEILTNEFISNHYYNLVKKYFGDSVVVDELIKYEWMRIPHFYYDFYVYKYATGLSAATYIAKKILSGDSNMVDNYKAFLKTGGRMYPLEELKIAGVDMTNAEVVMSAIDFFEEKIDEFEKLYDLDK